MGALAGRGCGGAAGAGCGSKERAGGGGSKPLRREKCGRAFRSPPPFLALGLGLADRFRGARVTARGFGRAMSHVSNEAAHIGAARRLAAAALGGPPPPDDPMIPAGVPAHGPPRSGMPPDHNVRLSVCALPPLRAVLRWGLALTRGALGRSCRRRSLDGTEQAQDRHSRPTRPSSDLISTKCAPQPVLTGRHVAGPTSSCARRTS